MWPKAIAQLIELAPHVTRLVPLADRFFQSKSASEEATQRAMDAMSEGLRGDLGQVTASHAGLYRQLNDQNDKLSDISLELRSLKASADTTDSRLAQLERQSSRNSLLLFGSMLLNVICVVLIVLLLNRH